MIHLQIACPQSNWRKSYVLWINRFNVGYKVFLFKGKLLKFEKIFTDKSHEQMKGGVLWNTAYIFFFFCKILYMNPENFHFIFTCHCPSLCQRVFLSNFGHWIILHVHIPSKIPSSAVVCAARSPLDIHCLVLQSNMQEFSTLVWCSRVQFERLHASQQSCGVSHLLLHSSLFK